MTEVSIWIVLNAMRGYSEMRERIYRENIRIILILEYKIGEGRAVAREGGQTNKP